MPQFVQTFFGKLPSYWKLSTIRCIIYAAIVGWESFKTGTEGYDSFSAMTTMQLVYLYGGTVIAMLTVWIAFLDNTISQVKEMPPSQDTQFIQKQSPSPVTQPNQQMIGK